MDFWLTLISFVDSLIRWFHSDTKPSINRLFIYRIYDLIDVCLETIALIRIIWIIWNTFVI